MADDRNAKIIEILEISDSQTGVEPEAGLINRQGSSNERERESVDGNKPERIRHVRL